jgi:prenyltransferase beta subunit
MPGCLTRRALLSASGYAGFRLAVGPGWMFAAEPPGEPPDEAARAASEWMTAGTHQAVDAGLAYLAGRQNDDGSFGGGSYGRNVAVCGLAGMALLAGGHTPDRGRYGRQVQRIVDFLLAHVQDSGLIQVAGTSSHGPMYGHGFATLFLAEVYGMSPHRELRDKLSRATNLIVATQNEQGGWRYQPRPRDADISVTICQIMALRAARNAGLFVPHEVVDRCISYVLRSQNEDGGFMYMLPAGPSGFPRSAAGVVALYSAGMYEGEAIRQGLRYIMQFRPEGNAARRVNHFFYGHYYAVQAMWQAGGPYWQRWYPAIRDLLVDSQQADGSWTDPIGPEYGTAMATLILQIPNDCVPIFQR